jgi:hypothetical protein
VTEITEKCEQIELEHTAELQKNMQQFKQISESSQGFDMLCELVVFLLFIAVQITLIDAVNNSREAIQVE